MGIKGGCCSKCNNICGFAIRISGTKLYLTNQGSFYQFLSLPLNSSPNSDQIFTLHQNPDCTWAISNAGVYLSTTTDPQYSGLWVGPSAEIGWAERWYIEKNPKNYAEIQSASSQYSYWVSSGSPNYFLGYSQSNAMRLVLEYNSCDHEFGWNW